MKQEICWTWVCKIKNNNISNYLSHKLSVKYFCLQKMFKDTAIIFLSLLFQKLVLGKISVPKVKLRKLRQNKSINTFNIYMYMHLNDDTNYLW